MTEVTQDPTAAPSNPNASTTEGWKQAAVHQGVYMPSGAVVDIKLPNLTALAKSGSIPNELLELVTQTVAQGGIDEDDAGLLSRLDDLHNYLVAETVVNPDITVDDVPSLPPEDVATLVEFAFRQRDSDITGRQLGGLEKVESFRRFRGLPSLDSPLLDV